MTSTRSGAGATTAAITGAEGVDDNRELIPATMPASTTHAAAAPARFHWKACGAHNADVTRCHSDGLGAAVCFSTAVTNPSGTTGRGSWLTSSDRRSSAIAR
jgi:hypothetical protein